MLEFARPRTILEITNNMPLSHEARRLYCRQAAHSECFSFSHQGALYAFGGFYKDVEFVECWFFIRPEGGAVPIMRRLVWALRTELMLRSILEIDQGLLVTHVRFDNPYGAKIAGLLGFVPGPAHPQNEHVQQWVFPLINP